MLQVLYHLGSLGSECKSCKSDIQSQNFFVSIICMCECVDRKWHYILILWLMLNCFVVDAMLGLVSSHS